MLQPQQEMDTTVAHAERCSTPDLRQEAQMPVGGWVSAASLRSLLLFSPSRSLFGGNKRALKRPAVKRMLSALRHGSEYACVRVCVQTDQRASTPRLQQQKNM